MHEKILLIEDEQKISRILTLELEHEGYIVEVATDGRRGLEKALSQTWDIILLDIMLPELNGLEVLRKIRLEDISTPIIILTARNSTPDIVSGLDLGANDYIAKPFQIEQLLARIRAWIRERSLHRSFDEPASTNLIHIGELKIDLAARLVTREGQRIELTPKEYDLLVFLVAHANEAMSREQIMNSVWGYDFLGDTNTVDVYIRFLRKKIDATFQPKYIQTVRGVGYMVCVPDEN